MAPPARLQRVDFAELPGWARDDHAAAFGAFRRSAFRFLEKPYRTGSLGVDALAFETAYAAARATDAPDAAAARAYFERHFRALLIEPHDAQAGAAGTGFVTGFYEPVVQASPISTGKFRHPLLARPPDLVDLDDGNRPAGLDPSFAFGRATTSGIVPFFDRGEIERGALAGRGLEIAWVADPVDAFFIHVQGAARLRMTTGEERRVTYAAKSGHPFTGPGRVLADLGEITRDAVTMQSIRAWFRDNPARIDEILWRNQSYIFFREASVDDPALGPVAAAKVPLTPGRSIAVDRLLHTFGTPLYVDAPTLHAFGGDGFRRLMIAQDTGSAIVGAARGDLFAGSGDAAGEIAGVVKHAARFFMLVPATIAERFT
jgi:membrane-bound lytic murein transglycosylase A